MSAKNKANLTAYVGVVYYRKGGTTGKYKELASTRGVIYEGDVTNVVDINSDSRGTAIKGVTPVQNITATFLENADAETLKDFMGGTMTSIAGGTITITDRAVKLAKDDTYAFPELSNDGNGVTSIEVKNSDGSTTYEVDTDYTITLEDDFTIITRVEGGAITAEEDLLISGSVETNSGEFTEVKSTFSTVPEFDIMIKANITNEAGETKFRTVEGTPATINATYQMEFIDFVKAGDITGATVKFDISEGGQINYLNEHLTA